VPRSDRLARRARLLGLRLHRSSRGWVLLRARQAERDGRVLPNPDAVEAELDVVRSGKRAAEGVGEHGIW
jgi:hypothetical protein